MSTLVDVDRTAARLQEVVSRLVARPLFWIALLALPAAWPLIWSLKTPVPPKLPVLATLPSFSLTDQAGRPFGTSQLEGRAWVASFIFTRCTTICPAITSKMARIQDRTRNLGSSFHLVSFSVDPEHDTPAVLEVYARAHRASPRRWSFLTGPDERVKETVVAGLKIAVGREKSEDGRFEGIFHGSHLVLIDQRGRVRGYYDSDDDQVIDRVVRDAGLLANRGD
jgi:protein SCO1/2